MTKLPKTLFVKIETPENGPSYPVCDSEITSLVEMGEKLTIGVYQLVEKQVIEGVVDVSTLEWNSSQYGQD